MAVPLFGGGQPPEYLIAYGCQIRWADTGASYLHRTLGASASRTTATLSARLKTSRAHAAAPYFFLISVGTSGTDYFVVMSIDYGAGLQILQKTGGAAVLNLTGTGTAFDATAWSDLLIAIDTTRAVQAERVRMWVNGAELTLTGTWPAQNLALMLGDSAYQHRIGSASPFGWNSSGTGYGCDGVVAEHRLIFDQYLPDTSLFGKSDGEMWVPRRYTGPALAGQSSFLEFGNPAALGADTSGLANDWTPTGILSTDQVTDSPTNNHPTYNPDWPGATIFSGGGSWVTLTNCNRSAPGTAYGTVDAGLVASYWEIAATGAGVSAGVSTPAGATNVVAVPSGATYGLRLVGGELAYTADGAAWTPIASGLTGVRLPYVTGGPTTCNFGQRPFAYTPPAGTRTLASRNLPAAAMTLSGSFTGNASTDGPWVWCAGSPETLTINGNAVTWGTHAVRQAGGFKVITDSVSYNSSGTNTWAATPRARYKGRHPNTAQGAI